MWDKIKNHITNEHSKGIRRLYKKPKKLTPFNSLKIPKRIDFLDIVTHGELNFTKISIQINIVTHLSDDKISFENKLSYLLIEVCVGQCCIRLMFLFLLLFLSCWNC